MNEQSRQYEPKSTPWQVRLGALRSRLPRSAGSAEAVVHDHDFARDDLCQTVELRQVFVKPMKRGMCNRIGVALA